MRQFVRSSHTLPLAEVAEELEIKDYLSLQYLQLCFSLMKL